MKHIIIGLLFIWLFIFTSCANIKTEPIRTVLTSTETISTTPLQQLVSADNDFGFRMFRQLTDNNPQTNIFISPTSIEMCLRMLYNGAARKTKTAIAKTLGLSGLKIEQTNQANLELTDQLKSTDEKVVLNIANSLWANQTIKFKPNFLKTNQRYYNAEVDNLSFIDPKSASLINNWVTEKTNNKITQIVDNLNPTMIMILVNAIYFNGKWSIEFDKTKTRDLPFTLLNKTTKKVPMMTQNGDFQYFEDDKLQAISLPYSKGRMSMYVFLPKQIDGLADFITSMNEKNWQAYLSRFQYRKGDITLPRFKFEYEKSLSQALIDLGMVNTFSDADFTNMTDTQAFVSDVIHKTFVEVNEEGTEAAAVTTVFVTTSAINEREPFAMIVDHPFFCTITDNQTGAILFMGAVVELR